MKIYVASSWRCSRQPEVVHRLREAGHEVYDFRNPSSEDRGFAWSEIDTEWLQWESRRFRKALQHSIAIRGYITDMAALQDADVVVLVLPCGRSAHLEAGWAHGAGKRLIILLSGKDEPELMYRMADEICVNIAEMVRAVNDLEETVERSTQ